MARSKASLCMCWWEGGFETVTVPFPSNFYQEVGSVSPPLESAL